MDTFVDSSWYFLRFCDPENTEKIFSKARVNSWMPVDVYVGGVEHAILHLLYSRFITKFLNSEGLLDVTAEPFKRLLVLEMVHGKTYKTPEGKYLKHHEVDTSGKVPIIKATGKPAQIFFEKMSKSKHNGVDPLSIVAKHGADTTRLFILFKAPPEAVLDWDEKAIVGQERWIQRLWR